MGVAAPAQADTQDYFRALANSDFEGENVWKERTRVNKINRLWHRVRGHVIIYHPADTPTFHIDVGGKKTDVYFVGDDLAQRHDAHYACGCGKTWS